MLHRNTGRISDEVVPRLSEESTVAVLKLFRLIVEKLELLQRWHEFKHVVLEMHFKDQAQNG